MPRILLFITISTCFIAGCYAPYFITHETVWGDGEIITEERDLPYFSSVRISGARTTILYGDSDGPVKLTGDSNILNQTRAYVQNEELIITSENNKNLKPTQRVLIEIPGSYVHEVRVSGSNHITLLNVDQESLRIRGSGSTIVKAEGFADFLDIQMSGSSDIDAAGLMAAEVTIQTSGSSHAVIHALDAITSKSSGSSSIRYIGQPANIINHSSGSSSLQSIQ